jgi:cytochrome P450
MPVAYDEPIDTWLLSRHADVRMALTDPAEHQQRELHLADRAAVGSQHRLHGRQGTRRPPSAASPAFRSRALTILQDSITEVTGRLIAKLRGREAPTWWPSAPAPCLSR